MLRRRLLDGVRVADVTLPLDDADRDWAGAITMMLINGREGERGALLAKTPDALVPRTWFIHLARCHVRKSQCDRGQGPQAQESDGDTN
jgi:hypothetical protein